MLLQINPSESWGHSQEVVVTDNARSLGGLLREISAAIEMDVQGIAVYDAEFEEWITIDNDMDTTELTEGSAIRIAKLGANTRKKIIPATRQEQLTLSLSPRSEAPISLAAHAISVSKPPLTKLIAELLALKASALRKRCKYFCSEEEMETAEDSDDPKQAMVDLVVSRMPDTGGADDDNAARRQDLIAELLGLKPSVLRKRVLAAGYSEEEMETAEDSDDPKQAMVDLVVSRMPVTGGPDDEKAARRQALIAELSGLKPSALRKRVLAAGCAEEEMEEAEDAEDPQQAMIDLVVARMPDTGGGGGEDKEARRQALVAELSGLKASALRKRVLAAGCSEEEMEEAEDAEDPQQAMIDLVVARMPDTGGGGETNDNAAKRKALIAELSRLKPSTLRRRCLTAGILEADVEKAEDATDSKEEMVNLIVARTLAVADPQQRSTVAKSSSALLLRGSKAPAEPAPSVPQSGSNR